MWKGAGMTLSECIKILTAHNKWRRGDDNEGMADPVILGEALDFAIEELHRLEGLEK